MRVIYVDDEQPALQNFRLTVADFTNISSLQLFRGGEEALGWAAENEADVAFLDMEMPGIHGLELARKLKELIPNIKIVFVTAYSQFALEAFGVDAIGYVLKPYAREDIQKELQKAERIRAVPQKRVMIQTIPNFTIFVDGQAVHLGRTKSEELLALLVDRGESGITSGEAIAYLWPDRPADNNTQSLFRVTFKRMMTFLSELGIEHIVRSKGREKFIVTDQVECDLYEILAGDMSKAAQYTGEYLGAYSWAETRNAQLNQIFEKYRMETTERKNTK